MSTVPEKIVVTLTNGNLDEYPCAGTRWRIRNDQTDWLHIDRGDRLIASYPSVSVRSVRVV